MSDISTAGAFSFSVTPKKNQFNNDPWISKARGVLNSNSQLNRKYETNRGPHLNTRSGRPGIPSYDYAPSYTNRNWLSQCYWFEEEVTILSDVLQKMRDEVMRYGFRWKPSFAKKCTTPNCGQEYDEDVTVCEICGNTNLREPNKLQLRQARIDEYNTIIEKANMNKQALRDVLKSALFHMLLCDNGYVLAIKDYQWQADGTLTAFPREYFSLDPRDVIKLFDFETGFPGKGRVCVDHRSSLLSEKDVQCPQCGKPTFRAFYQVFTATKTSTYYVDDEIYHMMYYYPSMIYGTPKALKIKDELISYHMIEKRVRNYYEFCKVAGILFIPTDDPEALTEMWAKVREDTKDDPFTPAVLGVSEMAPTNANFIKMMQDPNADLIAIKDELRTRIASAYGITLAFVNDTSGAGGVKNNKNMISLADRTIRSIQQMLDDGPLRWMRFSMGITDWKLEMEPNINENKIEIEEVRAAMIANASMLAGQGLDVTWKGDTYNVSKGKFMSPEMAMMGMAGGMGGTGGGMGMPAPGMPPGGAPMPESMSGVPMAPNEMGGMAPSPAQPQPQGMGELDAMASGQVEPEPQPEDSNQKYELAMQNLKEVLGGKGKKPGKKKVTTKLSNIIDEMFLSNDELAEKRKREQEEAEQQQQPPMGGGMPGMDMAPPAMPGMGAPPGGAPPAMPPMAPPTAPATQPQ